MIYQNFLAERPKSDIIFYRAFCELKKRCKAFAIFKGLLACGLLGLTIVNFIHDTQSQSLELVQVIVVSFIVSVLGMGIKIIKMVYIFSRPVIFLAMAYAKNHTVADETVNNYGDMRDCVSERVFIANTPLNEMELDEVTKKTYLNAAIRSIEIELPALFRGVSSGERMHSLFSIVTVIYSIVELCDPNINLLNKASLITYVVLVGLSELIIILIIVAVCLVPVICLLFCFYTCCCKRGQGGINLPVRNATMEDILKVEGDCIICYQNIAQNQRIYQLTCSDKHIFHEGCLKNWVRIKPNCPICRAAIQGNAGPAAAPQP